MDRDSVRAMLTPGRRPGRGAMAHSVSPATASSVIRKRRGAEAELSPAGMTMYRWPSAAKPPATE